MPFRSGVRLRLPLLAPKRLSSPLIPGGSPPGGSPTSGRDKELPGSGLGKARLFAANWRTPPATSGTNWHSITRKRRRCLRRQAAIPRGNPRAGTPGAYKDIDAVMAAQRDLVAVEHTLKQIVCVKG